MKKRLFSVVLILVMLLLSVSVQARSDSNNGRFTDVNEEDWPWAYEYIELMSKYRIIEGYGNGLFGPDDRVSREQFAKMMVLTLQLETVSPSTPYFTDVTKKDWSYPYIETARPYLTGYRSGSSFAFRPQSDAEREDMAVAIVRGLGLSISGVDLSILDQFADKSTMSENLKPYIAKAVEEGIMIGDGTNFGARNTLKRAEAAVLLARLIVGEKVVFDEEKVIIGDEDPITPGEEETTPVLSVNVLDEKIKLQWTQVDDSNFKYYKVVASKNDPTPIYPGDGYMQAIGSVGSTETYIRPNDNINNGDTSKLLSGERYYISITAVYEGDNRYASNVIQVTVPTVAPEPPVDTSNRTPVLEGVITGGGLSLDWSSTNSSNFKYYKVVFSRNDTTPVYPGDGYLTYISDNLDSDYYASAGKSYNGGDIGGELESGVSYHVSITAVYKDGQKYYPSNTISYVLP